MAKTHSTRTPRPRLPRVNTHTPTVKAVEPAELVPLPPVDQPKVIVLEWLVRPGNPGRDKREVVQVEAIPDTRLYQHNGEQFEHAGMDKAGRRLYRAINRR